ncbi:aminoglycoside phosphotransferase family protein [Kineosporia sp. J2-2]|uniref:Aminoglycoside phosphotransferase family protein n=1 Tax=Kineosporia corallincola TaxID=2835133 RepID=A0ABS5TPT3_9ACTN|nr:aminoglycoside phosphotransferase family protein [Kineosporia corallincola]MBT0772063.1 aminoglycoside phosphotransferase family protein [Kineosporia corallincola]
MESTTKNRQPVGTLRAMVTRAYGPGQLPGDDEGWAEELAHGWFNVVYRIRLLDGRRVVLKIAPPAHVEVMTYERGAMATELTALELIRRQTTVPVPDVHFADRSHELCDADYFFMSHVDGDNLAVLRQEGDLGQAGRDAYDEALGALNRELNQIPGPGFGPLTGPVEPSWRDYFLRRMRELLHDGERRGVDLGLGYDEVRQTVAAHADALDEVTRARFVEWDLWPGNAIVRDGALAGIIDHERAFYGDPLVEAGFTGIDMPDLFGDATPFMRGYGMGAPTPGERRRRRLYSLYLILVMVIETEYRGHTTTEHYDWARDQLARLMKTPVREVVPPTVEQP